MPKTRHPIASILVIGLAYLLAWVFIWVFAIVLENLRDGGFSGDFMSFPSELMLLIDIVIYSAAVGALPFALLRYALFYFRIRRLWLWVVAGVLCSWLATTMFGLVVQGDLLLPHRDWELTRWLVMNGALGASVVYLVERAVFGAPLVRAHRSQP